MASIEVTEDGGSIFPTRIDHRIDEGHDAITGDGLYHYNYLVYDFDHPAGAILARSYLDEIESVALYWPQGVTEHDPIAMKVIAFLSRRYAKLSVLGAQGYLDLAPQRTR